MITRFSPPAHIGDVTSADILDHWSTSVLTWFRNAEGALPADRRFFNLVDRPIPEGPAQTIPWNAFPRKYALLLPDDVERRWELGERVVTRDLFGRQAGFFTQTSDGFQNAGLPFRDQDEYCEWRTVRAGPAIERVIFTCENPEYWEFVAANAPDALLQLYQQLVSPAVRAEDLFFHGDMFRAGPGGTAENLRGRYNPLNRWNTTDGIVHLTHPANSLQAEIRLAGDATVLRRDGRGNQLTDDVALICCAGYGDANRSSDPTIGGRVNSLVRSGVSVTLDDPVGLYISGIDLAGIETPDGTPSKWWRPIRPSTTGTRPMILRAEFAPPAGSGLSMSDVMVGGEPLRFGSQLAELLTMVIYGRGVAVTTAAPVATCEAKCCRIPQAPALLTIHDLNETCPPVEQPRGVTAITREGPLAALADATPVILSADALPIPSR